MDVRTREAIKSGNIFNLFSSSQEALLLHILSTVNGNDIATN